MGLEARVGEMINKYRILLLKPEGKRALGKPRCSRTDYIKGYIKEFLRQGFDWVRLAQYRDECRAVVNAVMNLLVP